jgi:ribonuclease D
MSKDHQVSEWRIRPIPHAMLDYARRDSMIMPFLVRKMLLKFETLEDLKDTLINGLKHAKKNKKPNQPLIKNLIPL